MVADGRVDALIFLRDPLTPHPHEPDVHVLLRVCDVRQVPVATNLASAEILLHAVAESAWRRRLRAPFATEATSGSAAHPVGRGLRSLRPSRTRGRRMARDQGCSSPVHAADAARSWPVPSLGRSGSPAHTLGPSPARRGAPHQTHEEEHEEDIRAPRRWPWH